MNIAVQIDILVQDIKHGKITFHHVQEACVKIMNIKTPPQTPLETCIANIIGTNRVRVETLLEKIYIETQWIAEEFQAILLSINDPEFRYMLFMAFTEPLGFVVDIRWWNQEIQTTFSWPFDTKHNLERLKSLVQKLASIPKWTILHAIDTPIDQQKGTDTFFELFLSSHVYETERFLANIFKKYPKEAKALKQKKKVKITFHNDSGKNHVFELCLTEDTVNLFRKVQGALDFIEEYRQEWSEVVYTIETMI
jgi:hypothetical protein